MLTQYSKSFDWWDWVRFQNLTLPVSRWWENKSNIKSKNGFCGPSHPSLINNSKRRISSEISVPRFYWLIIIWRRGVSSDGWWPGAWCLVPGGFELWTLNIDLRIPPVPVPSSQFPPRVPDPDAFQKQPPHIFFSKSTSHDTSIFQKIDAVHLWTNVSTDLAAYPLPV